MRLLEKLTLFNFHLIFVAEYFLIARLLSVWQGLAESLHVFTLPVISFGLY